jgi:hypothetical protein
MANSKFDPTIIEEGLGAVAIAATILSSPLTRSWYSKWGTAISEVTMSLPGDEFVPQPVLISTRAITIQAPASTVWSWLVQIGQGRGALFSRLSHRAGSSDHPLW